MIDCTPVDAFTQPPRPTRMSCAFGTLTVQARASRAADLTAQQLDRAHALHLARLGEPHGFSSSSAPGYGRTAHSSASNTPVIVRRQRRTVPATT